MGLESRQPATNHLVGALTGHIEARSWANVRRVGVHVACALALVAATTAVILALTPVVDFRHTLAIYFIPVLVATLWWDFAVGLVTALASLFLLRSDLQLLRRQSGRACRPADLCRSRDRDRLSGNRIAGGAPRRVDKAGRRTAGDAERSQRGRATRRCRSRRWAREFRHGSGTRQGVHHPFGRRNVLRWVHPGSSGIEVAPAGTAHYRDPRRDRLVCPRARPLLGLRRAQAGHPRRPMRRGLAPPR